MRLRLALLALALSVATQLALPRSDQAYANPLPNLDGFLRGLERSCTGPEAFEALANGLREWSLAKPRNEGKEPRIFPLPAVLQQASGVVRVQSGDDRMFIDIPLRGQFRGIDVAFLSFAFKKQDGARAFVIGFDSPLVAVTDALKPQPLFGDDPGSSKTDTLLPRLQPALGRTLLSCDDGT